MEKLRPGEDMSAAIASLKDRVASLRYYLSCEHDPELEKEAEVIRLEMASLDRAIAVLRDWPRWEELIEVAKRLRILETKAWLSHAAVDPAELTAKEKHLLRPPLPIDDLIALLAAIPGEK